MTTQNQISLLMADGSVRSFASIAEASESTGAPVSAIRKGLDSSYRQSRKQDSGGSPVFLYAWKPSPPASLRKPVAVFPAHGGDTLFFPSLKDAANALGVSAPYLSKAIRDGSEIRRGGETIGFADLALDSVDAAPS